MSAEDVPPPPPADDDLPPPPAEDEDEDNETTEPPPPPGEFDMTEEEASGEKLAELKAKVCKYAKSELAQDHTKDLATQIAAISLEGLPPKAVWAVAVFFYEHESEGDEKADYLEADWVDWDTPQVAAFATKYGVEKKDTYTTEDLEALVSKCVDAYVAASTAIEAVPPMLGKVSDKLKEKESLGSNLVFRQSLSLKK